MNLRTFELPFDNYVLRGDTYKEGCDTVVLHGAGKSSRARFSRIRKGLNTHGLPSVSFDFIGHGETGGEIVDTNLHGRTEQAAAVISHSCIEPLTLIAASMSAYTAIRLTEIFAVNNLILLVPAVYTPQAYDLAFGTEFSTVIRVSNSWQNSDAFSILEGFKGNLLIIAAEYDNVIPIEVIVRIHESARHAKINILHTVPDSEHLTLFPKSQDFHLTLNMIKKVCHGEWDNKANSADAKSRAVY